MNGKDDRAKRAGDHLPAPAAADDGLHRREFLQQAAAGGLAVAGVAGAAAEPEKPDRGAAVPVRLTINGKKHELKLEPRVSLLDALREYLGLTGTKKGCDHGQCGACTVLVEGR